jgi:SAM-dependent methyltransferase
VRLQAGRFLAAAAAQLDPIRAAWIYHNAMRDHRAKVGLEEAGYAEWLAGLIPWIAREHDLRARPRILDFGCGTGELAVLMAALGFPTTGLDLHAEHLALAQILAEENGMPRTMFVRHESGPLPFERGSFDLATLFVVLEHLDDRVLDLVLPELRRVCRGPLFVLVPNRLQTRDDHTGLPLLPWMPRPIARLVVVAAGPRRRYALSRDGTWDAYYRSVGAIRRRFARHGYAMAFVPAAHVYPPLAVAPPLFQPGTPGSGWRHSARMAVGAALRATVGRGAPLEAWYPYLNLVFAPDALRPQPAFPDAAGGGEIAGSGGARPG